MLANQIVQDNISAAASAASAVVKNKRVLAGEVVSNKMKDTIVVLTYRYVKHPKYKKYLRVSKRYKAHDPGNTAKVGDKVKIVECSPISKEKHFKLLRVEDK
jgi:small subunit ribosomal protein S17